VPPNQHSRTLEDDGNGPVETELAAVTEPMPPRLRVAVIEGTRYPYPLDALSERRIRALGDVAEIFHVAFAEGWRPRCFTQHDHFYLLPKPGVPIVRYAVMLALSPAVLLWVVLRKQVRVVVARRPYDGFAAALVKQASMLLGRRTALIVENRGDFEAFVFLQRRIFAPRVYRRLMRWAAAYALRHADALQAVSVSSRRQLEAWGYGQPIVEFPSWIDVDLFKQAATWRAAALKDASPEILYVGYLVPRKGVMHLVEAFARVSNRVEGTRLVIVGRAENRAYARELRRTVARLNLEERVIFTGALSQPEVACRMSHAQVLVLPTLAEGLPRILLEAMTAGLPIITTPVAGIPQLIEDGGTGLFVPPGDSAALAERLLWVLTHAEAAAAMGQRARESVARTYSQQDYSAGYARLFALATASLAHRGGPTRNPG
jgi:glycosyltransferase involved in cell wall biosynthesis